ncbi:GPI-anchored protein LORELEI-like [Bidens hawaiensis]|uniref:GPI-anchored protein LORELEI-like n=1 Tax=Bidens hawaiensis TaxID=980011 RepID=UPI00404A165F
MKIWISFIFILLCCISTSSPVSISDDIYYTSIGRNLLQAKKRCPVDFEHMNYTIITSRCKAPQYPREPCCDAFKEFACPYSDDLNDLSTDCSERMFSYINLYGNYTQGLFGTICRDEKIGLVCPASPPGAGTNNPADDSNNSPNICSSSLLTSTLGFIIFLFMWI